jgi:hypothetical protein
MHACLKIIKLPGNYARAEDTTMQGEKRKCEKCGALLTDEDVMKIKNEDGSWTTIPLPVCPECFAKSALKTPKKA